MVAVSRRVSRADHRVDNCAMAARRPDERVVLGPDWPPLEYDRAELDRSSVRISVIRLAAPPLTAGR